MFYIQTWGQIQSIAIEATLFFNWNRDKKTEIRKIKVILDVLVFLYDYALIC